LPIPRGAGLAANQPLIGQVTKNLGARFGLAVDQLLKGGELANFAFGNDVIFDPCGHAVDLLRSR
jgi:hypothetical protein